MGEVKLEHALGPRSSPFLWAVCCFNLRDKHAITHRLIKKLTSVGYYVTLQPAPAEAVSETA